MIKPGLLIWIFKDETMIYVRFLSFFGIGLQKVIDEVLNGYILLLGIWKFEIGIHLGKRRGEYVERIKNEKSPQASA